MADTPLKQALRAKTEAAIARIRQEAADEAKAILAEARREADATRQSARDKHTQQAQTAANRIVREAEQAAARREADAVDALTDALVDHLRQHLREADGYDAAFTRLLDEGRQAARAARLPEDALQIYVVKADRDRLNQPAAGTFEGVGGVVVTSADGAIRFDNALTSRLEEARPHLRRLIHHAEL